MSKNRIRLDTEQQKGIYERFRYLADRYGCWEVWSDFVTMSACSLCLSSRSKRDAEYATIAKKYRPEEVRRFEEMFALTVETLEANPNQDFLGDLFMRFDLGNTWKGQFFTPYNVCQCMAAMTAGNLHDQLKQKTWITVNDPAVGAGALLIAFAQECLQQKVNYQTDVLFVGQDVDRTAAMMCFLQLSLIGCPGYVIVGDSLLNPATGPSALLPVPQEGQEIWYTPMFFTDVWQWRVAVDRIKYLKNSSETEVIEHDKEAALCPATNP